MDLGRPVARHHVRRPHEIDELEEILVEVTDEPEASEQPVRSESSER